MDQFDTNNFEQDFEKVDSSLADRGDEDQEITFNSPAPAAFKEDFPIEIPPKVAPAPLPDSTTNSTANMAAPVVENISTAASNVTLFSSDALLKNVDPRVIDLIYWRDVKKTGIVFGSALVLLLSLAIFSVLSVIAYLSLAALSVTSSFYLYKRVLQIAQKTGDGHPFKHYLEADVRVSEENVRDAADQITKRVTDSILELRRLFLIGDLVDTLKFGLLLWLLTYIGSWFNGMTLLILGLVAIFSIPKFYETNKTQIDDYVNIAKLHLKKGYEQVQQKIPILAKKKKE